MKKITLVGEVNPYGGEDEFALYPAPDGCSGHRLCCLILGMRRKDYLETFNRVNLCAGNWSLKAARLKAELLWSHRDSPKFILCGSKVSSAFQVPFNPLEISEGGTMLVINHPSGLCRAWGQPGYIEKTRQAVLAFAPELADLIQR